MPRFLLLACGLTILASGPARAQTAALTTSLAPAPGQAAPTGPTIYFVAEQMPEFPGGSPAMLKFLSRRLQYPAAALNRSLSGKVHVRFTVDPEGRLHDPQVVHGLGAGLDEEALRLVRLMPWWTPGTIQGQPVWVSITLPIMFRTL